MAALPYMPLFVADYLADTAHLTTREHGAYLLLIMTYWQRGKSLPADPVKLARITRLNKREFDQVWQSLQAFFLIDGAELIHGRVEHELQRVRDKSLKSQEAGRASAERRFNARSTPVQRPLDTRSTPAERTFNHTDTDTDTDISIVITPNGVTPNKVLEDAIAGWNDLAAVAGLAGVQRLTEPRRRALKARLSEAGGIEGWLAMLERVRDSSFLTGGNDRGWRADFDFVVKESNFTKIMEGKYDRKEQLSAAQRAAKRILSEEADDAIGEIFKSLPF